MSGKRKLRYYQPCEKKGLRSSTCPINVRVHSCDNAQGVRNAKQKGTDGKERARTNTIKVSKKRAETKLKGRKEGISTHMDDKVS